MPFDSSAAYFEPPLRALHLHEAHRRPGHGLADRLGVGGIVLLPLHIWLHIARRYELHLVAQRAELTGPIVRRSASFDADQARRQLGKKRQDLRPPELATDRNFPDDIHTDAVARVASSHQFRKVALLDQQLRLTGIISSSAPEMNRAEFVGDYNCWRIDYREQDDEQILF